MARPNNGARLATNSRGIYEIRWTEAGRSKRVSTGETDLQEAQRILAGWLVEKEKEDAERSHPTVSMVLDDYLREHVQEQVLDKERAEGCVNVLKSELGDFQIGEVTANRLAIYKKRRKSGLVNKRTVGDSTLRRELNCLIAAFNHARKQRRISIDDIPAISLPPQPPPKDLWLTREETDALLLEAAKTSMQRLSRIHRFVATALPGIVIGVLGTLRFIEKL